MHLPRLDSRCRFGYKFFCSDRDIHARHMSHRAMYGHQHRLENEDIQELRRAGGRWLRELRETRGLSQRQLANLVGVEYYTFVSQLETGRGRVPVDRYLVWADALKVDPASFVQNLMRFYDPVTHNILFGQSPIEPPVAANA